MIMDIPRDAVLLRIVLGEADRADGRPLYEAIVLKAREMHLAGATVLRGPLGFGHSSRLHTSKILRLSEDLPLVIEIVDSAEKIEQLLAAVEPMMESSLITLEKVQVRQYGRKAKSEAKP
jgi:PII-like signaling protein